MRTINMEYGRLTDLEKFSQGIVYFVTMQNEGRVLEWFSPWLPDFTEGSFWRPSDCFLMIPPANWECE